MSRALLQLRNTPDRDTGLSPAIELLGRQLRDFLSSQKQALMGDMWTIASKLKPTTPFLKLVLICTPVQANNLM